MTERRRREKARWRILQMLEAARPLGANEKLLRGVLSDLGMYYSVVALRNELTYLRDLELIKLVEHDEIDEQDSQIWAAMLTPGGIMIVERSMPPPAGIDCPPIIRRRRVAR